MRRSGNDDKLFSIRRCCKGEDNNLQNVSNQSQTEFIAEFTSTFDLSHRCEKSVQAEYVKKLYLLCGE